MTAVREQVLAALEKACRERVKLLSYAGMLSTDEIAARYGPLTPLVAKFAGTPITQVRKVLDKAAIDGLVVRYQFRGRGMINWWTAGLAEKLQQERKAKECRCGNTVDVCVVTSCEHAGDTGLAQEGGAT